MSIHNNPHAHMLCPQVLDTFDWVDIIMRPHRLHYVGWFENCLVPGHLSDLYYQEAGHLMVRMRA